MRRLIEVSLCSVLLAGCSGAGLPGSVESGASGPSTLTGRIARFFDTGGSSRPQRDAGAPAPVEEIECPPVTVREGASTYRVNGPGEESALNVRYQASIARTARDCKVSGSMVTMTVGVEGRLVLGAAGQPGTVNVPLRFAVVKEGPNPVTITTKAYQLPVTLPPGAANVPFVQVDSQLSFPLAPASELEFYVVFVGFDPAAAKPERPARKRRRG